LLLLASAGTLIRFELTRRRKLETSLRYEKDLFTTLMDTVPACICFKDMESRFLRINAALGRRLGVPDLAEAIGKSDTDYYAPEYAKKALSDEKQVLQTGRGVIDKEQQAVLKDGREMWVTYSKLPIVDHNGSIAGTYGISRDITLEKRADQALESANSTLANRNGELELRNRESTLLGEMGELLQGCVNEAEAETILSKFAPDLFPTLPGSLCTMKASRNLLERRVGWGDVTALAPLFTPDDCLALRTGQRYGSGDSNGRIRCPHIAGTFTGSFVCIPMMAHGETLGVLHLIRLSGKALDKTELRLAAIVAEQMSLSIANLRLHEALKAQSIRDPLTGLFNRRYLEESMDREFHRADRAGSTIAAIMLDLDHFKRFNDTFGHDGGDAVLKEFSALLLTRTRKEDIVCRYGGEEFLIVLPGATLEDARIRAGELLEAIRKLSVVSRGRELGPVSASMGVALYPEQGSTIGSLIRAADNALYRAKTRGRDCVVLAKTNSEAAGTEKPQVSDSKL
jgi:diguanylate cyclase (GGDEF)-like protein/PAS domain S-box-containing protein